MELKTKVHVSFLSSDEGIPRFPGNSFIVSEWVLPLAMLDKLKIASISQRWCTLQQYPLSLLELSSHLIPQLEFKCYDS